MNKPDKFLNIKRSFLVIIFAIGSLAINARESKEVSNLLELRNTALNAKPGDVILLKNGDYSGKGIRVLTSGSGTKEKPVILRAKEQNKIFIKSLIKLEGDYIWLEGVNFTGNGKLDILGKGCRASHCTWTDSKNVKWLRVLPGSSEIEIDHNTFQNKTENKNQPKNCQLLQVYVLNKNEQHHIHHNLFKDIPKGAGGNGFETIQLITRNNPFDPVKGACNTIIEDNLFLRCNGEAEIISIKSNGNIIRRNTFRACRGGLVLRHGDNNIVSQNYFFGEGEKESGGVRLQGTGQIVVNNYFQDLGQYGLAMMDGTPDDLYIRVENAQILFNSFLNCKRTFVIGLNHSKHPNGTVPKDCTITGNILYNKNPVTVNLIEYIKNDQPENWHWQGNVAFGNSVWKIEGVQYNDPHLNQQKDGLLFPTSETRKTKTPDSIDSKIKYDLFGKNWKTERSAGAIQFPASSIKNTPLTEKMVGANAIR